jgi:NAD-dependent SIR2 family protein deacetylase
MTDMPREYHHGSMSDTDVRYLCTCGNSHWLPVWELMLEDLPEGELPICPICGEDLSPEMVTA